jgi:hypothetical protein
MKESLYETSTVTGAAGHFATSKMKLSAAQS